MKKHKIPLAALALFIVLIACVYPASADLQMDKSVFEATDLKGKIILPNGTEMPFEHISDFENMLKEPILAGSKIEVESELQLRGETKEKYFIELSSELSDISWEAEPNRIKSDILWSDYSGTTYLWMPPSHDIIQLTITLKGTIPQPVREEFSDVAGMTLKRALIKEVPLQILNFKVKESTSEFKYEQNPQIFVTRSIVGSNSLEANGISTNDKIIETKKNIEEMNQALSNLDESIATFKGEDEIEKALIAQYESEKKDAKIIEELFSEGYPDIASEMAKGIKANIGETNRLVALLPAKEEKEGSGILWIVGIIGLVIGIFLGLFLGYLSYGYRSKR